MTLTQIKKAMYFIKKVESANNYKDMEILKNELKNFYREEYTIRLKIQTFNTIESYSSSYMANDKASVQNFIEGLLAKNDVNTQVADILKLIEEGRTTISKKQEMTKFISKVYYAFSDKIQFDETTKLAATAPRDVLSTGLINVDDSMLNGALVKLQNYAISLLEPKQENSRSSTFQINNYNTATATNTVDISIVFLTAREQVENEGLSDIQTKEILEKLTELESIAKSKETKGKRWTKVKDIMKWLVEQGIQVAGILLPVMAQTITG